ncbi:MAG: leucine-rich repeat domain-containing protein [Solobacterium sp.]|nr:leucine-rich repeat domain-containing protein [Solobacterium sp.]
MLKREKDNRDYVIDKNGVLVRYEGHDTDVVLPDGIKVIGSTAFDTYRYGSVVRLTVPEGVTEIEDRAFENANELKEIILPSTLNIIGESAFKDTRSLQSVTIPEGVTEIADCTFMYSGVEEIHLPKHLKRIGYNAFYGCSLLKEINLPDTDDIEIGKGAFSGCVHLINYTGMLIIQNRLFAFNDEYFKEIYGSGAQVTIPDHVVFVEDGVFEDKYIDITMSINCPSWNVRGTAKYYGYASSIINTEDSTVSFRNADGEIVAKVILVKDEEDEPVENGSILSIRCKETGGFDFAAYDSNFAMLTDRYNKLQVAMVRLRYPYELSKEMEEQYVSYLRQNNHYAGKIVIDFRDRETLTVLEKKKVFTEKAIAELIEYAQEEELTEFVSELLDYQNREFGERDIFRSLELPADENGGEEE